MAKMTAQQVAAAVIVAALQFRQKWDADLATQTEDRAMMTEEQRQDTAAEMQPETMEEGDFYEQFADFMEAEGLGKFLKAADSNIHTIARLYPGEAAFTLRAQDILASILTKHWAELASLNGDCPAHKINHAIGIAERMESWATQKWPD